MSEMKYKICSRCGAQMRIEEGVMTSSIPPMYRYHCPVCGGVEFDLEKYPMPDTITDGTINIPLAPLASFDWQAFRAEAAKDILCALLSRVERFYTCVTDDSRHKVSYHDDFVRIAIRDADELIKQLKEDGTE